MIRPRFYAVGLAVALIFAQTIEQCFDDVFPTAPPPSQTDLASKQEFDRQMSAMYAERSRRESEARLAFDNALRTRNAAAMDQVIANNPYETGFRYTRAALALALQGPEAAVSSLEPAREASDRNLGPNAAAADQDAWSRFKYLEALRSTMGSFPEGSAEWNRLHNNYCDNLSHLVDALVTPNYTYLQDPNHPSIRGVSC